MEGHKDVQKASEPVKIADTSQMPLNRTKIEEKVRDVLDKRGYTPEQVNTIMKLANKPVFTVVAGSGIQVDDVKKVQAILIAPKVTEDDITKTFIMGPLSVAAQVIAERKEKTGFKYIVAADDQSFVIRCEKRITAPLSERRTALLDILDGITKDNKLLEVGVKKSYGPTEPTTIKALREALDNDRKAEVRSM
ncbi:hypothetical protein H0O00_00160 [Candidatus Micrarchaeota archaeon]|nr:hypothetical protein [Candidatus Micrarchaeota archaeon]